LHNILDLWHPLVGEHSGSTEFPSNMNGRGAWAWVVANNC
jgi:hypothetical protein